MGNMKKYSYYAVKYIGIFVLLYIFFFIIDINLSESISILPLEIFIFALVTEILIFRSYLRLAFIIAANISLLLMIILFVLGLTDVANIFGSLGFGIFIITAFFYLPQLVKYGYIEKI